jgi:molybdopterin-guanine dinucleotide biosynthesis protein B
LSGLLRRLSPVDLVIVEGFKADRHPKIEVHRAGNGKSFLFDALPAVRAIASDVPVPRAPVPVIPLDDVAAIADRMLASAESIASVIAALETRPHPSLPSPGNPSGPSHG